MQYVTTTFRNGKEFGFSAPYIVWQLLRGALRQYNTLTEI